MARVFWRSRALLGLLLLLLLGALAATSCGKQRGGTAAAANQYRPGMVARTEEGLFSIAFTSEPGPPRMGMNTLTLQISDTAAAPVSGAFIKVSPYMPAHGHGSNSQPAIFETAPGLYRAELVELQMMGHWTITVTVNTIESSDAATFDFEVQ